jgi:uncharacterized membrane protein YhiD involved in acid resistance
VTRVARALIFILWLAGSAVGHAFGGQPPPDMSTETATAPTPLSDTTVLVDALIRLPAASLLGAALAFRPKRRGTPPRNPAVIQTQILLAVVGALVMMVVGSSLARAFGIVGAAGLIRYRAKIEDPKDAGVMLATLGVGLATGVGLYLLAVFATLFFLVMLGIVESLNEGQKLFDLTVEAEDIARIRPGLEALLQRQGIEYELRSFSDKSLCYAVRLPLDCRTDRVSNAIHRLAKGQAPAVGWEERKAK